MRLSAIHLFGGTFHLPLHFDARRRRRVSARTSRAAERAMIGNFLRRAKLPCICSIGLRHGARTIDDERQRGRDAHVNVRARVRRPEYWAVCLSQGATRPRTSVHRF
ncbi:unnamed protein product [Lampetra planeri]